MGWRDLPLWGRLGVELANDGLDQIGARRCAVKGHRWRDVGALVLDGEGGVEELARGAMQRCRRCGATRPAPPPPSRPRP